MCILAKNLFKQIRLVLPVVDLAVDGDGTFPSTRQLGICRTIEPFAQGFKDGANAVTVSGILLAPVLAREMLLMFVDDHLSLGIQQYAATARHRRCLPRSPFCSVPFIRESYDKNR